MKKIAKKTNISYEEAYKREMEEISKNKVKFSQKNSLQVFEALNTKYGQVKLYCTNNTSLRVVIFVHGIYANSKTVIKLFDYYLKRNYKIITYDNIGWGENTKYRCTYGKKEGHLLNEVIKTVKKHFKEIDIVHGESMGGGTVYSYLGKYGNKEAKKFIIDSGYNSFIKNVLIKANEKFPIWPYVESPLLALLLWLSGIQVKKFVSKKKLKKMKNIYHFHTPKDDMVDYKMMLKYSDVINFKTIKNIRHVRAYYDSKEELYAYLDKIIISS